MSLKMLINRMQEINESQANPEDKFKNILYALRDFFTGEFNCREYEISLMLKDKDDIVHFVLPKKLYEKGNSFPVSKSKVTRKVIEFNKSILNNDTRDTDRLAVYERLRDAEKDILPIQKFMAVPLCYNDEPFGALWVNRRAESFDKAGPDFTQTDIDKVIHYLKYIAPHLFRLRLQKYI